MSLQIKRLKVLQQIDRQTALLCDKCQTMAKSVEDINCTCDASIKLRELGDRLLQLVSPRKCEGTELLNTLNSIDELTVKFLKELRRLKITDKRVAAKVGISLSQFDRWKRENGALTWEKGKNK